jgi:hypothetical protein
VPPAGLVEFIGEKPEAARREQLQARRERLARPMPKSKGQRPPAAASRNFRSRAAPSRGVTWQTTHRTEDEQRRINKRIAEIFGRY